MKNISNNIGISRRCTGTVEDDGRVTNLELISYDLVAEQGVDYADMSQRWKYEAEKVRRELEHQELLKSRKEKIQKLNTNYN